MSVKFKYLGTCLCLFFVLTAGRVSNHHITDGSIDEVIDCIMKTSTFDKSYGLETYADDHVYLTIKDSNFLIHFVNDSVMRIPLLGLDKDSAGRLATVTFPSKPKVLTLDDVDNMLSQLKSAENHAWDINKLGFSKKNKKIWYSISKPVFSVDGNIAIVKITEKTPSSFDKGTTYLVTKKNNVWKAVAIAKWSIMPDVSKSKSDE